MEKEKHLMRITKKFVIPSLIAVGAVVGGALAADAITPAAVSPVGAKEFTVCAKNSNNVPVRIYSRKAGCSTGYHQLRWEVDGSGAPGKDGKDAVVSIQAATPLSADGTVLSHIGGRIGDPGFATPLTSEVTLQPGTYQVTAYGDFSRKAGTGADNPASNSTFGTMFLWGDLNGDNAYDWKTGEALAGTVQTGALPITPTGSIEQSATINETITLTQTTKVQLGGFGYNSNTGSYGTDGQPGASDFSVLGAHATFTKLNVPATN